MKKRSSQCTLCKLLPTFTVGPCMNITINNLLHYSKMPPRQPLAFNDDLFNCVFLMLRSTIVVTVKGQEPRLVRALLQQLHFMHMSLCFSDTLAYIAAVTSQKGLDRFTKYSEMLSVTHIRKMCNPGSFPVFVIEILGITMALIYIKYIFISLNTRMHARTYARTHTHTFH